MLRRRRRGPTSVCRRLAIAEKSGSFLLGESGSGDDRLSCLRWTLSSLSVDGGSSAAASTVSEGWIMTLSSDGAGTACFAASGKVTTASAGTSFLCVWIGWLVRGKLGTPWSVPLRLLPIVLVRGGVSCT
jgi:hypothetical protein